LLLLLAGCGTPPGKPRTNQMPLRPDQVMAFDDLYSQNCAACHGKDGKAGVAPPLDDRIFLASISNDKDEVKRKKTQEEVLARIITEGRKDTLMPAFAQSHGGGLTSKQVEVLAKEIVNKWALKPDVRNEIPTYRPGKEVGDVAKGTALFRKACAGCHGSDGQGNPPHAGAINNVAFLALTSEQALRRIIITGRPDLPVIMPDFENARGRQDPRPLTNQDVADLVALLASWKDKDPFAPVGQKPAPPK